jgi:hypothetical protein
MPNERAVPSSNVSVWVGAKVGTGVGAGAGTGPRSGPRYGPRSGAAGPGPRGLTLIKVGPDNVTAAPSAMSEPTTSPPVMVDVILADAITVPTNVPAVPLLSVAELPTTQ